MPYLLLIVFHSVAHSSPFLRLWPGLKLSLASGLLAWVFGIWNPGRAVETITLEWGPLSQQIQLQDLTEFAATGQVPADLKLYSPFLTPQTRQALRSHLDLDPAVSHIVIDELLHTPGGTQLLNTLKAVAPNLSPTDLQVTITQASTAADGLSVLGILQALPEDTLDINLGTLLSLAAQFNLARLESEALSRVLEEELPVGSTAAVSLDSQDPARPGTAKFERWELVLRDRSRDRNIPIDLYWSDQTHGPLVVISHGFGADRRFFAYLAEHLASHGLTVVSVEHPGSNVSALVSVPEDDRESTHSRVLPATEFLDRPKDISFVLDRMEKLNQYSYSLRDRLNSNQVTLIGHSLGGYTGLALAGAPLDLRNLEPFCQQLNPASFSPADWLQCAALDLPIQQANLTDPRITQLVIMNPLTGLLFGENGLHQVTIPVLMVAGTHDRVTPMAEQQLKPFIQLGSSEKYLATIIRGTHLSLGDPENLNPELSRIPFMPKLPTLGATQLRSFIQGITLSFILHQDVNGPDYSPYLTASYAERYSTAALPLRLTQTLPDSLTRWPRLVPSALEHPNRFSTYGPSLLHLEAIAIQHQFQTLQRQMVAYLRTSPPSLTAVYLPRRLLTRPSFQAKHPE